MRPLYSLLDFLKRPKTRRTVVFVGAVLLIAWIGFFDSHSVWRRANASSEAQRLARENAELQAQIEHYQQMLQGPLTDEAIERAAREQYGMRRPGETVYPIETRE